MKKKRQAVVEHLSPEGIKILLEQPDRNLFGLTCGFFYPSSLSRHAKTPPIVSKGGVFV